MKHILCGILVLAAVFGWTPSSPATVYLNQTNWPTSGSRTYQGLPTNSAWYASSVGSLTVASGSMRMIVSPSSGAAITYFTPLSNSPPIQLNVGDTMTATF